MMKSVSRKRMMRWLPRFGLLFVLMTILLAAVNSRSLALEPYRCDSALGQNPVYEGQALDGYLDILSWNIQKASNDGWADDLKSLTTNIHLAFLQEASVQADIPGTIGTGPIYQAFTQGYSTEEMQTGVMTLSSHSPSMLCNFTSKEPWLGTPKTATVTEHPLVGRDDRLLTINIHAVNFTLGVEDFRLQLEPLAQLLARHNGPAILAGDFNTWSTSRQQVVDQLLPTLGLSPLVFADDKRSTAFGKPLDHIYVRGMVAESAEVVPVSSSDHNALRARLQLLL